MKLLVKFMFGAQVALALGGCTHALHLSHVDDIRPSIHGKGAERIKSDSEQFTILGFVTQTDYVNQAYAGLAQQCPDGEITGINTRYSTSHGFLSWTNRIHMSGWCTH